MKNFKLKNSIDLVSLKKWVVRSQFEKDSCGVGLVANIKVYRPEKSWMMLSCQSKMDHRGGCGFEENTGDGAGILIALPDSF